MASFNTYKNLSSPDADKKWKQSIEDREKELAKIQVGWAKQLMRKR